MRYKIRDILNSKTREGKDPFLHQKVRVCGWVRSCRNQKNFSFIELNDGSMLTSLQVIVDSSLKGIESLMPQITTGASLSVYGEVRPSPAKGQTVELHAEEIELYGTADATLYPLQKKRHSFEFLRTIAHLRPRTNTQGALLRVRSSLAFATHLFFQNKGFIYIHTPIITGNDCEGGGDLFNITTEKKGEEFFGSPAYLTVSGQLDAESLASALGDVYTFGPTFRAENSHTSRHLAEFWMIEPEMAFCDLLGAKNVAEEYIKFILRYVLENQPEDLAFFDQFIEKGLLERLDKVISLPFAHLTYTDAISILQKAHRTFEFPVKWGIDLQSEHERFLSEEHCKAPVVVTDYPKEIKAFYMRLNEDGKTVRAMDLLVPKVGELFGGSQREERFDYLRQRMLDAGLNLNMYDWYLDLRRYGTVPHSGFGLGFERLLLFVTGMENIRDVIPFPRYPGYVGF